MTGRELFACYAFPPNELGYCGPADTSQGELASHARDFDGAWPYLQAIAEAARSDPLDDEVVRNYWIGGALLDTVDPDALLTRLRRAFTGQVTGLLDDLRSGTALAHHSFHVFAVYPWVRFLDRDPTTPLQVMQDCRIRWGTVESLDGDHAVIVSAPLALREGILGLADAATERVRWRRDSTTLGPEPVPGTLVSAHWDWVCGVISEAERDELADATRRTLDLVNEARSRPFQVADPG